MTFRTSLILLRELEREKLQARYALLPLIKAEEDRKLLEKEAKLLHLEQAAQVASGQRLQPVYHNTKNYIPSSIPLQ